MIPNTQYKGITVQWDEDRDERIYIFIDSLTEEERKNVMGVSEHEGGIEITWRNRIIGRFDELSMFDIYDKHGVFKDSWLITNIIIIFPIERNITKEIRYKVLKRQRWICNICAIKLKFSIDSNWDGVNAHIDHIHPYSQRKTYIHGEENINELENLQGLCPQCNLGKKDKMK